MTERQDAGAALDEALTRQVRVELGHRGFGPREFNLVVAGAVLATASFWVLSSWSKRPPLPSVKHQHQVADACTKPHVEDRPNDAPPAEIAVAAPSSAPESEPEPEPAKQTRPKRPSPKRPSPKKGDETTAKPITIDGCKDKGPLCDLPD